MGYTAQLANLIFNILWGVVKNPIPLQLFFHTLSFFFLLSFSQAGSHLDQRIHNVFSSWDASLQPARFTPVFSEKNMYLQGWKMMHRRGIITRPHMKNEDCHPVTKHGREIHYHYKLPTWKDHWTTSCRISSQVWWHRRDKNIKNHYVA